MMAQQKKREFFEEEAAQVAAIDKLLEYGEPIEMLDPDDTTDPRNIPLHKYSEASQVAYDYINMKPNEIDKFYPHLKIDHTLSDNEGVVILYPETNELTYAHRGTVISPKQLTDLITDIGISLGAFEAVTPNLLLRPFGVMNEYDRALDKYKKIKEKYPDKEITATGHSKGASIALKLAREYDLKSWTFATGSSPVGAIARLNPLYGGGKNEHIMYIVPRDLVNNLQKHVPSKGTKVVMVNAKCWSLFGCRGSSGAPGHSLANYLHPKYKELRPELFGKPLRPGDVKLVYPAPKSGFRIPYRATNQTNELPRKQFVKPINKLPPDKLVCSPNDPYCLFKPKR